MYITLPRISNPHKPSNSSRFHATPSPPPQDMIAEAMRVGLPKAEKLFAEPEGGSGGGGDLEESGTPSKADRGKAEGAVLGLVRSTLASRYSIYLSIYFFFLSICVCM